VYIELFFTFYCDLNILYRSSGAPTNWWIIPTQEEDMAEQKGRHNQ